MKKLILLVAICTAVQLSANPFLIEVNNEWLNQSDVSPLEIKNIPKTENESIQLHLQLVERILRNRDVSHLKKEQQANRLKCLNILNAYWKKKRFPQNENCAARTPIFIDQYNTFCAVGQLMKESGFENVAREISQENNLVYVRDITNPKAVHWMKTVGLSMEECAWIQPGYAPLTAFNTCGNGVNGEVTELHSLDTDLLVLGNFNRIDSSINAMGIAKWRKLGGQYFWEDFSQGIDVEIINGSVFARSQFNAAIEYNGTLWLGGEQRFQSANSNAYHLYRRVNSSWQLDSSIRGKIYDFEQYNGKLYACGNFSDSSGNYFLAEYDALLNTWQYLFPTFTINPMYDMEVYNGNLIIGGGFNIQYLNCYNIFSFDGNTISGMYTGLRNTVHSIEVHQGKLYAAGIMKGSFDIYNMKYWNGSVWLDTNTFNINVKYGDHISCLKSVDSFLFYGGSFQFQPLIGTYALNLMTNTYQNWGAIDSTVNDIELFDGKIFLAGAFNKTGWWSPNSNHIAYIENFPTSVNTDFENQNKIVVYPNPTTNIIRIESSIEINQYEVFNVGGQMVNSGKLRNNEIDFRALSKGVYFLKLKDYLGHNYIKRILRD